ncbi:MAG TPA: DUF4249 domain-containing protein [Flavisolibacter sp.]|nr:DUF4249 domain-containing protein [Flavisolibacter sp.]
MTKMNWLLAGLLIMLLPGCEKKIDFKLNEETPRLVVEATIENGQPPRVILTKSFGFFSNIDPRIIAESFVHNAEVFVSNGSTTHKLKEYSVPVSPALTFFYYSTDSSSFATAITGALNHSYTLKIVSEGREYAASTTIPNVTKSIDSLWWKPVPGSKDSSKAVVMVKITDPPGYGDYIRYFTKNSKQPTYFPPVNSVFDDLFVDGTTYEVQIQPGIDRNADSSERDFFNRGDTVSFKISNIDKATYDFWRTWEFSYSSVGNPFSTPTKVLGNISNNALGYFGGYASQYRTLIIPH